MLFLAKYWGGHGPPGPPFPVAHALDTYARVIFIIILIQKKKKYIKKFKANSASNSLLEINFSTDVIIFTKKVLIFISWEKSI